MSDNLAVYHPDESCRHCEVSKGEEVWRKELGGGEAMSGKTFLITAGIQKPKQQTLYDHNRRSFFTTIFNEIKATNKLAIQEAIGGSEIQSYREKLQEEPLSKVKTEWSAVTNRIVEKVTNESAFPYMNKRKLIFKEIQKSASLQKRKDYRLPTILPDCNFCGACTTLCPTSAITKEEKDGSTTITLQPQKCVDCHLCEDICFFQNIFLQDEPNIKQLSKTIVLA
ncbi:4Fe-4S dicluster domain-containing protein [Bacillus sp. MM2020_1]|nr:4Fe-4S dicluster domain-containing protein [Bacillus sp. MM2020_1]